MSSKQKKILGTATAVILILALGLAETFAASGSADSSGNIQDTVDTSIVLHDDFSKTWVGDIMDRDVYVENTGDSSLYIRMRLDEFMKYGNKILAGAGGTTDNTSKWKPHVPFGGSASECDTEVHDYFTLQMGNDVGIKYKPGVQNAYKDSVADADKTKTTPTAKIILIEDYLNASEKPDSCWIYDPEDGYAYWHTQLKSKQATGLILNSITNTNLVDESYYYGINAKAEAVTEQDLSAWFNGTAPKDSTTGETFNQASTNAIRLLKNMSLKYIEITQDMKDNGASDFDSDNDGYLTKQEQTEYENAKGLTPDPDAGLNNIQKKVKAASVGGSVTIDNAVNTYGASTDWLVLSKTENEALLLSKNCITSRTFHDTLPYPTWSASDIRNWLNSDGIHTGNGYLETLSSQMKAVIKKEDIKTASAYNDWSVAGMNLSKDFVFLLTETGDGSTNTGNVAKSPDSTTIVNTDDLKCSKTTSDGNTTEYWWLRSPRFWTNDPSKHVGVISCLTTTLGQIGVAGPYGIRPALTVTLK